MPRPRFCSQEAIARNDSPVGSGWHTTELIVIELPLPWDADLYQSSGIPNGVRNAVIAGYEKPNVAWGIIGIAPDPTLSVEGKHRLMAFRNDDCGGGLFERREWLVSPDQLGQSLQAIVQDREPTLADAIAIDPTLRDVLVCTHGRVDACCATFGFPAYRQTREIAAKIPAPLRVWRASHFGGHRFAPTYLELPSGRYWGRVTGESTVGVIARTDVTNLLPTYRGNAAWPPSLAQAVEACLFAHLGWKVDSCGFREVAINEAAHTATLTIEHPGITSQRLDFDIARTDIREVHGHCFYETTETVSTWDVRLRDPDALAPFIAAT